MDAKEIQFTEELYTWYGQQKERLLIPKMKMEQIIERLLILQADKSIKKTRDDFYILERYLCPLYYLPCNSNSITWCPSSIVITLRLSPIVVYRRPQTFSNSSPLKLFIFCFLMSYFWKSSLKLLSQIICNYEDHGIPCWMAMMKKMQTVIL